MAALYELIELLQITTRRLSGDVCRKSEWSARLTGTHADVKTKINEVL
jgi:hypothetical protein